ncbi:MAG TPA: hypothetical protein HA272_08120 [Methanoregula sp.]|nr:hypothetical protein [Methanoregula sp.]
MTYLDWGCEPLREECGSCLDAICSACVDEFKKRGACPGTEDGEDSSGDLPEPDCDRCQIEKKPDCARCEIILAVCRNCSRNPTCGFRIT